MRAIFTVWTVMAVAWGPLGLPATSVSGCDVNRDGVVDIRDVQAVIAALQRPDSGSPADVNNDGCVDVVDFHLVLASIEEAPAAPGGMIPLDMAQPLPAPSSFAGCCALAAMTATAAPDPLCCGAVFSAGFAWHVPRPAEMRLVNGLAVHAPPALVYG